MGKQAALGVVTEGLEAGLHRGAVHVLDGGGAMTHLMTHLPRPPQTRTGHRDHYRTRVRSWPSGAEHNRAYWSGAHLHGRWLSL